MPAAHNSIRAWNTREGYNSKPSRLKCSSERDHVLLWGTAVDVIPVWNCPAILTQSFWEQKTETGKATWNESEKIVGPAPSPENYRRESWQEDEMTETRAGISKCMAANKSQKDSAPRDEKPFKYQGMLPAKPLTSCTKTWHTPLFCSARLIFSKRDENRAEVWTLLWLETQSDFAVELCTGTGTFCQSLTSWRRSAIMPHRSPFFFS